MAIVTEDFSSTVSVGTDTSTDWTRIRGSVNLARVTSDNTGSARSTTNEDFRRNFNVGSADMFTEFDVISSDTDVDRSVFLHVRCISSGTTRTHYSLLLNRYFGHFTLLRYINGGAAAIASNVPVNLPPLPYNVRLEVEGSTLRIYINNELIRSYTDSSITGNSMGGVGFFNAGTATTPPVRIDNVRIGALSDFAPDQVLASDTLTLDSESSLISTTQTIQDTTELSETTSSIATQTVADIYSLVESAPNIFVTRPDRIDAFQLQENASLYLSNTVVDSAELSESATVNSFSDRTDIGLIMDAVKAHDNFTELTESVDITDSHLISHSLTDTANLDESIFELFQGYIKEAEDTFTLDESPSTTISDRPVTDSATLEEFWSSTDANNIGDIARLGEKPVIEQYLDDNFTLNEQAQIAQFLQDTAVFTDASVVCHNAIDEATLSELSYVTVIVTDFATTLDEDTDRKQLLHEISELETSWSSNVWTNDSDTFTLTEQINVDRREPRTDDLIYYERPRQPVKPFRVIAQDIFTKEFVHWDLPLDDIELTYTLSGPNIFSGTLKTEMRSLLDLDPPLEPERTWLHVEEAGQIRSSFILMPFVDDTAAQSRKIEGEGFSSYPSFIYYQGEQYQGVQVDPADMIRRLWDHVQSYADGNLGVQIDQTTKTPIKLGTEPKDVEFETGEGEAVSFVAGPYALNFWTVTNCGDEIGKLCKETPIEFVERSEWNETRTDVIHHIDLGYPRMGRRRDDLGFREGENLNTLIPTYKENKETYASEVIVVGAGDGPSAIRAVAAGRIGRIRRTIVIQNEDITTTARAQAIANFEFRRRSLSRYEIDAIQIDVNHDNAPWGSFHLGDDIIIEGTVSYVGTIKDLHRITSYKYTPRTKTATLSLAPSESFAYGALIVEKEPPPDDDTG